MEKEMNMYGIASKSNLARIQKRSLSRADVLDYDYNDYCLPFLLRLTMKLEDLGLAADELPEEDALAAFIAQKAAARSVSVRDEWFTGDCDPGEFRDSDSTRMNIYALCAALDADYQDCCEIFQKVFFKCPFLPKRKQELVFYYFAKKAWEAGEYGSAWYDKALSLLARLPEKTAPSRPPIGLSRQIYSSIEALSEAEFERFIIENAASFTDLDPLNEFVTARMLIRELAEECWLLLCRENPDEASYVGPFSGQYDALVDGILGFRQRSSGASASLSDLDLPKQLLSCFPSGKVLGDILGRDGSAKSNDANALISLDELSKMAILLLFYYYFSECGESDGDIRFEGFVRMANNNLSSVGLDYIYPGQPYGSFILYHAASDDPVTSLRDYMLSALKKAGDEKLAAHVALNAPSLSHGDCLRVVELCQGSGFSVRLCCWLLSIGISPAQLFKALEQRDTEEALLALCETLPPERQELLASVSLIPKAGLASQLAFRLIPALDVSALDAFMKSGLVNLRKSLLCPDAELGRFARQLVWHYDELRRRIASAATAMADSTEVSGPQALQLAAVLATLAPKLEYFKRAEALLRASRLYLRQDSDKKALRKAFDCAFSALEQEKRCLSRDEKKGVQATTRMPRLKEHYINLSRISSLLGETEDSRMYMRLADSCL